MVEYWRIDPADGNKYYWFDYLEQHAGRFKQSAIEAYWYRTCRPIFGRVEQERRTDPEDGFPYTFEELCKFYGGRFSKTELQAYWDNECKAIPRQKRAQRKLDPADMEEYTFEQLSAHYAGQGWSQKVIQAYWDQECAFSTISPLLLPATAADSPHCPAHTKTHVQRRGVSSSPLLLPSAGGHSPRAPPLSLPRRAPARTAKAKAQRHGSVAKGSEPGGEARRA